jgi:hypothetical protein
VRRVLEVIDYNQTEAKAQVTRTLGNSARLQLSGAIVDNARWCECDGRGRLVRQVVGVRDAASRRAGNNNVLAAHKGI